MHGETTGIYAIEDDPLVLRFLEHSLSGQARWRLVGHSDTLQHALRHAAGSGADLYLVDLGLPDGQGEELLRHLSAVRPEAERLVFTVFGDETRLIGALESGATGYVLKGCSQQELLSAMEQVAEGGAPISPVLARLLIRRFHLSAGPNTPAPCAPVPLDDPISEREATVLRLVAQGYSSREIGSRLFISTATVTTHIKNIYRKLSVHTRIQAVSAARERGLL